MPAIERIILIDDSEADNVYHQIMIERAGFTGELVVLEHGVAGLEYLQAADLDIPTYIFLDINMPMMDGFEVAERAAPLLRDKRAVILVMVSSSCAPEDHKRAGELEIIHGFITKPLTTEAVKDLLADPF